MPSYTGEHTTFALSPHDAEFLRTGHLSITAASRGQKNIPCVSRSLGCRLSADLRQVTLFFPRSDAQELLDHVASNRAIAAVFSLPSTHESLQLKGGDASVHTPTPDDLTLVASYCKAFVDHVGNLGYPRDLIATLLACEPGDLAAVTFTPSAAFSQTPGPHAGQPIGVTP